MKYMLFRSLVRLILAVTACGCASVPPPQETETTRVSPSPTPALIGQADLRWAVMEGTYGGKPMIVRVCLNVEPLVNSGHFPDRVGMAVPLKRPRPDSYPDKDEMVIFDRLEDAINERLDAGDEARMFAVVTSGKMREFIFQARNGNGWKRWLKGQRRLAPGYELQFVVEPDPTWERHKALLKGDF